MNDRKALFVLFLTVFIDLLGFGIIIPLLPFYAERFGAEPHVVTLLMAIYSLMQFLFAPLWGTWSDRWGRRPVLLLSLAGNAVGYVWFGLANALWALFAVRAFAGMMAGNIAAAQAYIADVTPPEGRAKGMGLIGAAFGLGFIFGPALGGVLAGGDPTRPLVLVPALTAAGLSTLALGFALVALPESLSPELRAAARGRARRSRFGTLAEVWGRPGLGLLIVLFFLVTFAFAGMESTFALWSERTFGWGARQNGYLFAFVGILGALIQGGLVGPLNRRFGEVRLLRQGAAALAVGLALIPFSTHLAVLVGAMALLAYGVGVGNPALNSLLSRSAHAEEQGKVLGASQSASSLARILGPAWAGTSFSAFGRAAPFLSGACVTGIVWLLSRRVPPPKSQQKEAL